MAAARKSSATPTEVHAPREPRRHCPHRRAYQARHLPDAVAALDVHLSDHEIEALEERYGPHLPSAF
jgi:hypothetical protein